MKTAEEYINFFGVERRLGDAEIEYSLISAIEIKVIQQDVLQEAIRLIHNYDMKVAGIDPDSKVVTIHEQIIMSIIEKL